MRQLSIRRGRKRSRLCQPLDEKSPSVCYDTAGMTFQHSSFGIPRLLSVIALAAFGISPGFAENTAPAHHDHAAPSGVRSLDVFRAAGGDGKKVDLLTGESTPDNDHPHLLYRHSEDAGANWTPPVRVDTGMPSPFALNRGMDAQIAAAERHLIAVWMTAGSDRWGSGPMATAISEDGGQTWTAGPNPADDGSTTGHGFIDLTADNQGTFHLTWLDNRDGKQGLRYARSTDGGRSWSPNLTVKAATCECCSNAILAGPDGNVAILFRDGDPRDMQLVRSADRGLTWLPPIPMGAFAWHIDGCPHVGGGLTAIGDGDQAVYHALVRTGKDDHVGLYHVAAPVGQPASQPMRLGAPSASHPDLVANTKEHLAAVWDDRADGSSGIWGAVSQDAGKHWTEPTRLSSPDVDATHPRVLATETGFRVFWTEGRMGQPTVWASATLP